MIKWYVEVIDTKTGEPVMKIGPQPTREMAEKVAENLKISVMCHTRIVSSE